MSAAWQHRIGIRALALALAALAASAEEPERRCIVIDVYARADAPGDDAVFVAAERCAAGRAGLVVVRRFPDVSADDRAALAALAGRHGFAADRLPVIHACGHAFAAVAADAVAGRLADALRMEIFVRPGCGRCRAAKEWLPGFAARHPGLEIVEIDIVTDPSERDRLRNLVQAHRLAAASVPAFHLTNRLVIGFDRADTTGARIEELLAAASRPCRVAIGAEPDPVPDVAEAGDETVDVPLFGRLDAARLGMPLFTLAIGLVDGFNPCAMWVLLLLLSILVNLQDRWRILAVAGTFILISGLAYLAFMAAWLNVFEWIGCLRPVQIALGTLAVGIGLVHVKDFVALGSGPTLSIPAAAKPGIYARIRRIVNAENLPAAIAGAVVLAVLVNVVELLCTAGLPALYTNVLAGRDYAAAIRYGYLGLYVAAYMFDDTLMVAAVVATLRQCRLQETGGRWLKLVSGGVILSLGVVMLLRPEWLG